jgi:hypothetical protein
MDRAAQARRLLTRREPLALSLEAHSGARPGAFKITRSASGQDSQREAAGIRVKLDSDKPSSGWGAKSPPRKIQG